LIVAENWIVRVMVEVPNLGQNQTKPIRVCFVWIRKVIVSGFPIFWPGVGQNPLYYWSVIGSSVTILFGFVDMA
jgi:hypothetical protein